MDDVESAADSSSSNNVAESTSTDDVSYVAELFAMLDQGDVQRMMATQKATLLKFEETNEMLTSFNDLSEERYFQLHEEFKNHTRTLVHLRKDLELVFRRIRALKSKLGQKYPTAFEVTGPVVEHLREKYLAEQERHEKQNELVFEGSSSSPMTVAPTAEATELDPSAEAES